MVPVDGPFVVADACPGIAYGTEPKPVVLEMVVDVSESMLLSPPDSADSKWNITRNALVGAIGSLPESVWIGVQFFPNEATGTFAAQQPHTACVNQADNVNIAVLASLGSTQRLAIDAAFGSVAPVSGAGTPTLDAYDLAVAELLGRSATLPTEKFILLVTGGQPTYAEWCVGDGLPHADIPLSTLTDPIVEAIGSALTAGIKTFVIGSPGSQQGADNGIDARPWLSEAARAGGTATAGCSDTGSPYFCHFDLTNPQNSSQALGNALLRISTLMVNCTYLLPEPSSGTNVFYTDGNGQTYVVARNITSTCDLGWHYTDSLQTEIEICGTTCNRIQNDPGALIDIFSGCTLHWIEF
jgi:hypothetical protein